MKILIVSGGVSSERKISLLSAQAVKEALEENGFEVQLFDLKKGLLALKKVAKDFDVIFPVIHGKEGEGGSLQKFLTILGKLFIGGDPQGTKISFDKILFNRYCDKQRIPKPRWKQIKKKGELLGFGFPSVLKAANGGSSKEVVILKSEKDLQRKMVDEIFKLDDGLLVEEFIFGVEITVGIFKKQALPVVEIVPPEGEWFDYHNKYSGAAKEIVGAPSISRPAEKLAQKLALRIHQDLKLGQYSRIDFIVARQEDSAGRFVVSRDIPYCLEVNPSPGVTKASLYPKAIEATGLTFTQWAKQVVESVNFL